MTSKDELRRKIRLTYIANHPGSTPTEQFIDDLLNLLEGEKQKIVSEVDSKVRLYHKTAILNSFDNGMFHAYKDIQQFLATLNKEPNKGEDVDG